MVKDCRIEFLTIDYLAVHVFNVFGSDRWGLVWHPVKTYFTQTNLLHEY